MRSVPANPAAAGPAFQFTDDVTARRTAIVMGGASGALIGGALWGMLHKHIGRVGVVFPIAGAVGGAYLWAGSDVRAAR
jgi:hypothetical protein